MTRISPTRCIALATVMLGLIPDLPAQGFGNIGTGAIPTSLQFNYQQGFPASGSSSSLVPQVINNPVSGAYTTTVTAGSSWLTVTPTGVGPGNITVSANPADWQPAHSIFRLVHADHPRGNADCQRYSACLERSSVVRESGRAEHRVQHWRAESAFEVPGALERLRNAARLPVPRTFTCQPPRPRVGLPSRRRLVLLAPPRPSASR